MIECTNCSYKILTVMIDRADLDKKSQVSICLIWGLNQKLKCSFIILTSWF